MEPGDNEQLTHLRRLADELSSRGLTARLLATGRRPSVKVTNPDNEQLSERVLCQRAADDSWCFWWSWQQPIGSADELELVSGKIVTVLRSVEGGS
jgi:hypothetical protein